MPLIGDSSFAAREEASLQSLANAFASVSARPVPNPAREDVPQRLALSRPEKTEVVARIQSAQQRAVALVQAYASAAARADEAARKAAAWGIAGTLTAAIVLVVVAIVTAVFSFGSSAGALAAMLADQTAFLGIAAKGGHPLAGELAAILEQLATSLRDFSRTREQDNRTAVTRLVAEVEGTLTRLERLPGRAATIKGPCQGDPHAVFAACGSLGESLGGLAAILQRVPREDMDTQPLVSTVATLRRTLTDAVRTLARANLNPDR
jgi:hypothetical protein